MWQSEKVTLATSVAFAERISAHKTLLNSGDLSGVFLFNGDCMDLIEAKRNLDLLHQDKEKLESLNHLNSTFQFKQACRQRINDIEKNINNIQHNIKRYARP